MNEMQLFIKNRLKTSSGDIHSLSMEVDGNKKTETTSKSRVNKSKSRSSSPPPTRFSRTRIERTSRRRSPVASTSSSSKQLAYYADPKREEERLQREHAKKNRSPSRRRSRSPYKERYDRRSRSRSGERRIQIQCVLPHAPQNFSFPGQYHPMMHRYPPPFYGPPHFQQFPHPGMFGPMPYFNRPQMRPRYPNYRPQRYP